MKTSIKGRVCGENTEKNCFHSLVVREKRNRTALSGRAGFPPHWITKYSWHPEQWGNTKRLILMVSQAQAARDRTHSWVVSERRGRKEYFTLSTGLCAVCWRCGALLHACTSITDEQSNRSNHPCRTSLKPSMPFSRSVIQHTRICSCIHSCQKLLQHAHTAPSLLTQEQRATPWPPRAFNLLCTSWEGGF